MALTVLTSRTLLVYKCHTCVLESLRLNITFALPPTCLTPHILDFISHRARCALGAPTSDFSPSTPSRLDLTQTLARLAFILLDLFQTPVHLTLNPSALPWTSFHLISYSCQSLVQPTCNRQVVNLPAGLDISFSPLWHVQTPVRVHS